MNRIKVNIARCSCVLLVGLIFNSANQGQSDTSEVLKIGTTCEVNILAVEGVMRKAANAKAKIFVISRRSKKEQTNVDWVRLKYTRMAITQFRGFPFESVKIAVGEPIEESLGMLEFWVSGELELSAYAKKNQKICFSI